MPGRRPDPLPDPLPAPLPSWAAGAAVLAFVGLAMLVLPATALSLGPSGPESRAEVRLAAVAARGALRVRDVHDEAGGDPLLRLPPPKPVMPPLPPADAVAIAPAEGPGKPAFEEGPMAGRPPAPVPSCP